MREIDALARRAGMKASLLTGSAPTRQAVLAALANCTNALIATHGLFAREAGRGASRANSLALRSSYRSRTGDTDVILSARNPVVESAIVLAAEIESAGGAGSRLTAEELVGIDLRRCRLVALSACDTGLAHEVTGQGVIGLRFAIMAAGARSMIMALWKVPDDSTRALME